MEIKIKVKIKNMLKILLAVYLLAIPGLNIVVLFYLLARRTKRKEFSASKYGEISGNTYEETINDTGLYGEYRTFIQLEKLKGEPKLFANLYIPKKDGMTTEIDIVMVDETGIYVFESKNYSGWIFGNEQDKNWTQTLKGGQKNRFYNPIWQNKGHIKALQAVLDQEVKGLYKSYIVFSERCTLKNISLTSTDVKVLKRDELLDVLKEDRVNSQSLLSKEEVLAIEAKLKQYCLANKETKLAHIEEVTAIKQSS